MITLHPLEPGRVPEPVLGLLRALQAAGHRAYLVGGAVREMLRGVPTSDWDVGTSARPEAVQSLFPGAIPTGLKHGTVTVPTGAGPCEVTTFRVEGPYRDARRPERVEFVDDLTLDLQRRDFTMNAIAWDPIADRVVDPHGGRPDLAAGVLRAVGEAAARFREDGLRPIRAARFAATHGFEIEEETFRAMGSARPEVARVSAERVRDELVKALAGPEPSRAFEALRRSELLDVWFPEIAACVAVPQNRYHAYDVYYHSLYTCDAAPPQKPVVRLAALYHDVGKPRTRAVRPDGEATFYNHQFVGEAMTVEALTRLRFSREVVTRVAHLVRLHMFDYRSEWTDAAVRRFVRGAGLEHLADLFDLRIADNLGNGTKHGFPHYLDELASRVEGVVRAQDALTVRDLAVDGRDVMRELRLTPGPRVGAVLDQLLEEVLDHPSWNERERLLRRIREGFSVDTAGSGA